MKCITHTDIDGKSAGAVVAYFEQNYDKKDFFECDYNTNLDGVIKLIETGETVYITDFSFTEPTVHYLNEIHNKTSNIVWCDHHASSIELQEREEYSWLKEILGIRSASYSGVALVYMYLYDKAFCEIPRFIQYISDFDNWNHKLEPYSTYFKYGVESVKNANSVDPIWKMLIEEALSPSRGEMQRDLLIQKGKIIKEYVDVDFKNYCDDYSYISEIDKYKCLVCNRRANSLLFGERQKEYPVLMLWVYDGEKYNYSIYSEDPNVDCSKMAEKRGGGGHKGAAGFVLDTMPFTKQDERDF